MEETQNTITGELLFEPSPEQGDAAEAGLRALLEAVVYILDEPLSAAQIAAALNRPSEVVARTLEALVAEYNQPHHGLTIREVAGGYKMATKAEHHEEIRSFVKNLKPPLKLSLAALETLAVIAYKQPITAPEVMEIRGVQGAGVLKTLLDRKLIATAGRKNVIGRPILYKTTKDFLLQFGLKDLTELPTLKEFEELGRLAIGEDEPAAAPAEQAAPAPPAPVETEPESQPATGEQAPQPEEEPAPAEPGPDTPPPAAVEETPQPEPELESPQPVAAEAEPQPEETPPVPEPPAVAPSDENA